MRSTIANKSQEQSGLSENRVLQCTAPICTPDFAWFCMVKRSMMIFILTFPIEGSRTPKILVDRWQCWLVVCQDAKRCTRDTPAAEGCHWDGYQLLPWPWLLTISYICLSIYGLNLCQEQIGLTVRSLRSCQRRKATNRGKSLNNQHSRIKW